MKKIFLIYLLILFTISLYAESKEKGTLPPVFPKGMSEQAQFDTRTRAYISPVRIMWTQNEELITGA